MSKKNFTRRSKRRFSAGSIFAFRRHKPMPAARGIAASYCVGKPRTSKTSGIRQKGNTYYWWMREELAVNGAKERHASMELIPRIFH